MSLHSAGTGSFGLTGLIGAENDVKRYEETMRINRIINTIKTEVQKKIPLKLTIYL